MKTTFDIPEPLLREVQTLARDRRTTTKSLVEQALRTLLEQHASAAPFALRDASFKGDAVVSTELQHLTPARMREAAYDLP
jgi:hypothetical protein